MSTPPPDTSSRRSPQPRLPPEGTPSAQAGGAAEGGDEVSLAEATRLWAKVGFLSFGGAAGQIAMLHRFVVEERRWIDERGFLDALNFVTLLPGPEAQQLATYLGWRLHGVRGGLLAGLLFVVPGAIVMLALSLLYDAGRGLAVVDGIFLGIKAAVLAIVAEALHRIAGRALKSRTLALMAVATFVAIVALRVPFPYIIAAAALIGALGSRIVPQAFAAPYATSPAGPLRLAVPPAPTWRRP